MSAKRRPKRDDRGDSLIELLVAVVVMATAVIALLGALATAIRVSEFHRHQSEAGAYVKAFAETLEQKVAEAPANYKPCGTPGLADIYKNYYPKPVGYTREVLKVRFWDQPAKKFVDTCPAAGDYGVQLVSLTVASEGTGAARATERLDVTLRLPCRVGDPACD
jgi:Tfp pilus assembly protein PilV